MDKYDKLFNLKTQECLCQHFTKMSSNKIAKFKKSVFLKYVSVTQMLLLYSLSFFDDKVQFIYHNVAVDILVQLEKECFLICKADPVAVQTNKNKWWKS